MGVVVLGLVWFLLFGLFFDDVAVRLNRVIFDGDISLALDRLGLDGLPLD